MRDTTKHTPGDWKADHPSYLGIRIYAGDILAAIAVNDGSQALDEHKANARLIAAAPELLFALKAACGALAAHGLTATANAMIPFIKLAEPDFVLGTTTES